jgi:hypothetical protein
MSPFGDGQHRGPGRGSAQLMYQFSTLLRDPYIRWYSTAQKAGSGASTLGFSLYDPSLKPKPPADLPHARAFPGAGLVAMHTNLAKPRDDVYLVLRSSPFGSISHGHADQNAFAIEAYGEALAIPSGYYPWYSSPHHHNWTRETKAKNCVTIDGGQGQAKRSWDANGRIVHFAHTRTYDYALADATRAYRGLLAKFLRHIVHARPGVFVVIDELEAPKPVTFEWWLHALEKMELDGRKRHVLIRRGKARLLASFIEPTALAFSQTDQFTPPPEDGKPNQWHLTASTKAKATRAVFIAVLRPHREAAEGTLPSLRRIARDGALGVSWPQGASVREVILTRRGIHIDGKPVVNSQTPSRSSKEEGQ